MEKEKLIDKLNRSSKVVGSKQVLKGISDGTVRCVIVASDADADLRRKIVAAATARGVKIERVPSKRQLGEAAGVEVSAAVVGLTKATAID
ncbi:MAG: ribosomal L7Ae/L30e/S12e/Gadd45 family protein [Clostridia bacterium]|nr:ribosomal L7Ae/L30e/S12e/Gadd45 family protein [Clostridia bacterium]